MRVTTKGQVTIPRDVRERLGIAPGDEVEFRVRDDHAELRLSGEDPGERLVRHLRGTATSGLTTDEIMAMTRGEE
jgi:AbrB family looped-hinge helix DNA binding protein